MNFGDSPKNVPTDFCSASISYEREHHSPTSKARQNVPNHLKPTLSRLNPDTFMVHVQNLWGIPNTSAQTFISPKPRSPMGCAFKTYERGAKLITASIGTGLESGLESGAQSRAQSQRILTRPNSGTPKAAAHSAFLMCRSCALPPAPGAPWSAGRRVLAQLRPVSVRPYVPLMCKPAASQRPGRRVPPPRPAATINRTMHSKLDDFIVHSREIQPLSDVLKNTKKDTNRPFLPTPAPSSF